MRQNYFVVGESLVDQFTDVKGRTARFAGGSAHNVAVLPMGSEWRRLVEQTLRHSHVVKASDEDLAVLRPKMGWKEAATQLLTFGPTAVVVTLGAYVVRLLRRSTMAGAIAVTRRGANPPSAAELEEALRSEPATIARSVET